MTSLASTAHTASVSAFSTPTLTPSHRCHERNSRSSSLGYHLETITWRQVSQAELPAGICTDDIHGWFPRSQKHKRRANETEATLVSGIQVKNCRRGNICVFSLGKRNSRGCGPYGQYHPGTECLQFGATTTQVKPGRAHPQDPVKNTNCTKTTSSERWVNTFHAQNFQDSLHDREYCTIPPRSSRSAPS